jgi:putative mRNA 3-end processing factor
MNIFRDSNIEVPFLCSSDLFKISLVYQNFGINLGNLLPLESNEAQELIKKGERHIIFHLLGRELRLLPKDIHYTKINVSRWRAKEPFYQISSDYYMIALSDHADFEGILEYVQASEPQFVITDNSRGGHASSLAEEIQQRLKIQSLALPR